MKELELQGPEGQYRKPGFWVFDVLRAGDKTRGGSVEVARANREWMKSLERREEIREEKAAKLEEETRLFALRNFEKYAMNERRSFTMG